MLVMLCLYTFLCTSEICIKASFEQFKSMKSAQKCASEAPPPCQPTLGVKSCPQDPSFQIPKPDSECLARPPRSFSWLKSSVQNPIPSATCILTRFHDRHSSVSKRNTYLYGLILRTWGRGDPSGMQNKKTTACLSLETWSGHFRKLDKQQPRPLWWQGHDRGVASETSSLSTFPLTHDLVPTALGHALHTLRVRPGEALQT